MGDVFADLVLKYGLPGACLVWAGSLLIPRIFRSRSEVAEANLQTVSVNARTDIIESMQARMSALELEQHELRNQLETERDKRAEAEDMVDALTRQNEALMRRVVALEARIRALGHEPV